MDANILHIVQLGRLDALQLKDFISLGDSHATTLFKVVEALLLLLDCFVLDLSLDGLSVVLECNLALLRDVLVGFDLLFLV